MDQPMVEAIVSFQAEHNLPGTGIIDEPTWRAIVGARGVDEHFGSDADGDGVLMPNELFAKGSSCL